ncbi:type II toxin-antitoxin system VapC family toxin [Candidatus Woesearchaeota archaeon]|nr:type II toxin-antitoxin system VapC family toxin [Candidatus Woesearchaeota archaeon]
MIVLDTSVLIELERGNTVVKKIVQDLFEEHESFPCIAFPTFAEFLFGFLVKYPNEVQSALVNLQQYELLNTSSDSARLFAELRYLLQKRGVQLKPFDLLIAAITMDHGMMLVTCDKQFKDVPGLKVVLIEI